MKLEDKVCTLEQAEKLRDTGIRGASSWAWYRTGTHSMYSWHVVPATPEQNEWAAEDEIAKLYNVPAYDTTELGVMLGTRHKLNTLGQLEAVSRADMLIYLIKNNHMTVEEVNARLEAA